MKQGQIHPFRRTRPVPIRRFATGSFAHSRAFGAGFFPPFGFGSFFLRGHYILCANLFRAEALTRASDYLGARPAITRGRPSPYRFLCIFVLAGECIEEWNGAAGRWAITLYYNIGV
jgi:hypothetical protein